MAVFTPVTLDDLSQWISQFDLGKAHAIKGISSGIENTNFFITTDSGEYVLTVFEKLTFEQLPFYLNLMRHLAERGGSGVKGVEVYRDTAGEWRWRLWASNGNVIADSGEGYTRRWSAKRAARRALRGA